MTSQDNSPISFYPLDQSAISQFVLNNQGQETVISFIDSLKSQVTSQELWTKACLLAESEVGNFNDLKLTEILSLLNPLVLVLSPGHDQGHFLRDLSTSLTLYEGLKNQTLYKSDLIAGVIAGAFHDIGNSITPRYMDMNYSAGHAEVGSWLFYHLSKEILGDNLAKLTSYAIAAHTHYLKPVELKEPKPYTRQPYWDELFFDPNDKFIGIATRLARLTDRVDCNGPSFIFRQIISTFYAADIGGQNISGDTIVAVDHSLADELLNPVVRDPIPNPPSALEHAFRFANSNFGKSPYSLDDHYFPDFESIITKKVSELKNIIEITNNPSNYPTPDSTLDDIKSAFRHISGASDEKFDRAWTQFTLRWRRLDIVNQDIWKRVVGQSLADYQNLLRFYREKLSSSSFPNTATIVLDRLDKLS